jgi:hypothetical protein
MHPRGLRPDRMWHPWPGGVVSTKIPARSGRHLVRSTLVLLPAGAIDRRAPTYDAVGKVLLSYSGTRERNRQAERAMHPPLETGGLLASFRNLQPHAVWTAALQ